MTQHLSFREMFWNCLQNVNKMVAIPVYQVG